MADGQIRLRIAGRSCREDGWRSRQVDEPRNRSRDDQGRNQEIKRRGTGARKTRAGLNRVGSRGSGGKTLGGLACRNADKQGMKTNWE